MKKKLIVITMAIILCLSNISVFADTISDKQNDLKESQNSIADLKNRIDQLNQSKESAKADLEELEAQVQEAQKLVDEVNDKINSVNESIEETQAELDKAIEEYEAEQELYSNRVKAMYMNGTTGYLELLLSSEGFGDFISRVETIKTVVQYDKSILQEMKAKQDEINTKKEKLEIEKSQLAELQTSYNESLQALKDTTANKEAYYQSIEDNVEELEKNLAAEEKESQAIEEEIKRLQAASSGDSNYSDYRTGILRVSDIGYIPPITSYYGWRYHPVLHYEKLHTGMDIGVYYGTPVYSMGEGRVILSEYSSSYGNYVIVSHGDGLSSLYAHLSSRLVSVGETVEAGQIIGKSGSTGYSTGPHLHFEVRMYGSPIDPTPYYIVGQ